MSTRNARQRTPDSPTCWDAALDMGELVDYLEDNWPGKKCSDSPEEKDFPILFTVRPWTDVTCELFFVSISDAKYLLSLKGIHIA